ncbi:MAG: hypothetical protein ACKVQK_10155, partial [Burkholderiales bacterium]
MIRPLVNGYKQLSRFSTWLVGFYAAPLIHIVFTSVFAAAGFAYGYARGQISDIQDSLLYSLIAGVLLAIIVEVFLNDGLQRLGIRTFI